MATELSAIVSREAENGFPGLAGTRLSAALVVEESTIVGALRRFTNVPGALDLHVQEGNRIALRFAQFRTGATIADVVDVQRPRLVATLDSAIVAWSLRLFFRRPALHVAGRVVSFDLGQLNAFQTYRRAWAHVRAVRVSTSAGAVRLHVAIAVESSPGL